MKWVIRETDPKWGRVLSAERVRDPSIRVGASFLNDLGRSEWIYFDTRSAALTVQETLKLTEFTSVVALKGPSTTTEPLKIFKIRNSSGQFSTGGSNPRFTTQGRTWARRSDLSNHLSVLGVRANTVYDGCDIVEFDMTTEAKVTPVRVKVAELAIKRGKS